MKFLLVLIMFSFSITVIQATPSYPLKIFSPKVEKAVVMQAPEVAFIAVLPGVNRETDKTQVFALNDNPAISYIAVGSSLDTGLTPWKLTNYPTEANRPLKRLNLADKRKEIFYKGRSNTSDS